MSKLKVVSETVKQTNGRFLRTFEVEWKIDDLLQCTIKSPQSEGEESVYFSMSPRFSLEKESEVVRESVNSQWQIVIHRFKTWLLAAYLLNFDTEEDDLNGSEFEFSFMDTSGQRLDGIFMLPESITPSITNLSDKAQITGLNFFYLKNISHHGKLLTTESLIVSCKMSNVSSCKSLMVPQNNQNDIKNLFELNETQSGYQSVSKITFRIEGKELRADKGILSVRSRVFEDMFTHSLGETNDNVIDILDFSYAVMKELLRFIYCQKVENLKEMAIDLIVAANYFKLTPLKNICRKSLIENLCLSNVFQVFAIANTINCIELKSKVTEFLNINLKKAVETPGFEEFKKSNPILLLDMIVTAIKK
ncbi:hypothetical protein QAD02_011452 [Eretmocerus hayati]|uniref:Uncharacterized protein n=1 Tax=Eretmocerus hayati TaxID=131215 RepID=A0ACC2NWZ6_9HYME|nr:hypothetical protein QAD02_011452 [Eretmocerus hayati]